MKNIIPFLLIAFLFLSPPDGLISTASGQAWVWGRQGAGVASEGWAVTVDAFGNMYGGGINQSTPLPMSFGSFTVPPYTSSVNFQSVWVKYDPSGTVLWADGTRDGATCIQNMTTDPTGNLIILGSFTSNTMKIGSFTLTNIFSDGSAQYFLAKISATGTVLWAINDGSTMAEHDLVYGMIGSGQVITDDTGNIYITSSFKRRGITIGSYTLTNSDRSGGTNDVFVAKYTPDGAVVWASSIGGDDDDYGMGITLSSTGYVYVSGAFYSTSVVVGASVITDTVLSSVAFIAKFSSSGTPLWAQSTGGNEAYASGLASDNSGNVYIVGSFVDSVLKFGPATFHRVYNRSLASTMFLAQYTPADTVAWVRIIESPGAIFGFSIAYAPCVRELWVCGSYASGALLGGGDTLSPEYGPDPVLIARYNTSGGVLGYSGLSAGSDDETEIACDPVGNVYICSDFDGATFSVGADSMSGIASEETFYCAKYTHSASGPDTTYASRDTAMACDTSGIVLTAPPGYDSYLWDNGSTGPLRTITASGHYFVSCIVCSSLELDTFNVVISSDTLNTHTDTVACSPSDAFFLTLTAPAGTNYLWYDDDTTTTHTENTSGNYWVSYIKGCNFITDTFDVILTTSSPPCVEGINQISANAPADVEFYPNPATDELTIQMDNGAYYSFTIANSIGQELMRGKIKSAQTIVNVKKLPAGLYYIKFTSDSGTRMGKFMKM